MWTKADSELPGQVRAGLRQKFPSADLPDQIQRLRTQRIAPVLPHLTEVRQVFAVGVHEMAGLPVELITSEFVVSYVLSGTFMARAKDLPALTSRGLLAIGDPIFTNPHQKQAPKRSPPKTGIYVQGLVPGGIAATTGLLSGDVILKYGPTPIATPDDLQKAIAAAPAGKPVLLTFWRDTAITDDVVREVPAGPLGVILSKEPAAVAVAARLEADKLLRSEVWDELPGAKVEVTGLRKLFEGQPTTVLTNGEASEAKLDALRTAGELKNYHYLHFATHGQGNEVVAFASSLILAQNGLPEKLPLPVSGQPLPDGKLSAREVLDFWRDGGRLDADLVTLSACETAVGRPGGGDGQLGFAQAFLTAGARSVCLSLWKVDDCATALLMNRFYENLLGKRQGIKPMPKADALHEAKRWLRELPAAEAATLAAAISNGVARGDRGPNADLKLAPGGKAAVKVPGSGEPKPFAHPKFWAAFVLIGDPR